MSEPAPKTRLSDYRSADAIAASATPATLTVWLRDGDKHRWLRSLYIKLSLSVFALGLVRVRVDGRLAASLVVLFLGGLWAWRDVRDRRGAPVAFHVRDGQLRIDRGSRAPAIVLELNALHDVRLDTKTASKNVSMARADGVNSVFGMASNHNIALDVSRIELTTDDGESFLLSRDFISGSLCTDALRTIRLFLRAHGWQPFDERASNDTDGGI